MADKELLGLAAKAAKLQIVGEVESKAKMNISSQTLAEIEKEMNLWLEEIRLLNQEVDIGKQNA